MTKQSVVLELQQFATDGEKDILDLLRRALLVATKLNLVEFRNWAQNELNGYDPQNVPAYRKCLTQVMGKNPFHGMVPVFFPNKDMEIKVSTMPISDSLSSLRDLVENGDSKGTMVLQMPYEEQRKISRLLEAPFNDIEIFWVVQRSQIVGILDAVRNTILEWALKLESEGILGDGISFSDDEKHKASSSTIIQHVENFNFQGVLGSVINGNLTQNLKMTVQKNDLNSLHDYLSSLNIKKTDIDELEEALKSDPHPRKTKKFGDKVSNWIGKMVGKAASGGWDISVAVAGQLLADAISAYYGIK